MLTQLTDLTQTQTLAQLPSPSLQSPPALPPPPPPEAILESRIAAAAQMRRPVTAQQVDAFSSKFAPWAARAPGTPVTRVDNGPKAMTQATPEPPMFTVPIAEPKLDILRTGQSFGEAVMFMDKPYVVMAQALADSTLLHIGKQVFFEEMNNDPLFCRRIIAGLAQRLHRLMGDVESYSLRSGRERIIGYLLREEETIGDAASVGRVSIRLPTSKGTIASRLNLTQEHFSRILNELTSSGLIEVEGRTIHIPDIGRLRCNVE